MHPQECFQGLGYAQATFRRAKRGAHTLALPIYPELTDEQAAYVVQACRVPWQLCTRPDRPCLDPYGRPMINAVNEPAPAVLMIAYTNYEIDPRVIRAAEAAAEGSFSVDFLALRRPGQPRSEIVRGVRVFQLPQERYRSRSRLGYLLAYLEFFVRCFFTSTRLFPPAVPGDPREQHARRAGVLGSDPEDARGEGHSGHSRSDAGDPWGEVRHRRHGAVYRLLLALER